MQIEVVIDGKGAVTIAQDVNLSTKDLKKLTTYCAEVLREGATPRAGFGGTND